MDALRQLMTFAVAQAESAEQQAPVWMQAVPWLLMFAAMYFIMLRPMWKQNKQQQELLKSLKKDDEVVTSAGIYGKINAITDRVVTLEVASGVKIKILRSNISGKWNPEAERSPEAPKTT